MKRRSILDVARDVIRVLHKHPDSSIKSVAERANSQWETTVKVLEFLKELHIVQEHYGRQSYKRERLFSLVGS